MGNKIFNNPIFILLFFSLESSLEKYLSQKRFKVFSDNEMAKSIYFVK
jgi:hypothetical protein